MPDKTPKCFQCGKQGQLSEFRRDGKLIDWCSPCIEKTAWSMQSDEADKREQDIAALIEALERLVDRNMTWLNGVMDYSGITYDDVQRARAALAAAKEK